MQSRAGLKKRGRGGKGVAFSYCLALLIYNKVSRRYLIHVTQAVLLSGRTAPDNVFPMDAESVGLIHHLEAQSKEWQDVGQHLLGHLRRSWQVDDEGLLSDACHCPRQHPQR